MDGDRLAQVYKKYKDSVKARNRLLLEAQMEVEDMFKNFDPDDIERVLQSHDRLFHGLELTDAEENAIKVELKRLGKLDM